MIGTAPVWGAQRNLLTWMRSDQPTTHNGEYLAQVDSGVPKMELAGIETELDTCPLRLITNCTPTNGVLRETRG